MVMIEFGYYMNREGVLLRVDVPTELEQGPPDLVNYGRPKSFSLDGRFREIAKQPYRSRRMKLLRKLSRLIKNRIRMDAYHATVNKYLGIVKPDDVVGEENNHKLLVEVDNAIKQGGQK